MMQRDAARIEDTHKMGFVSFGLAVHTIHCFSEFWAMGGALAIACSRMGVGERGWCLLPGPRLWRRWCGPSGSPWRLCFCNLSFFSFSNWSGECRIAGLSSRCEVGVDKLALQLDLPWLLLHVSFCRYWFDEKCWWRWFLMFLVC
jgi:hypothetical protein